MLSEHARLQDWSQTSCLQNGLPRVQIHSEVCCHNSILATRCTSRLSHLHTTSHNLINLDKFHLCSKACINDLATAVLIARAYCNPEVTVRPAASHKSTTLPHQQLGSEAMCFFGPRVHGKFQFQYFQGLSSRKGNHTCLYRA